MFNNIYISNAGLVIFKELMNVYIGYSVADKGIWMKG